MGTTTLAGPIVVGYDGSAEANHALRWAWQEAGLRHADLQVAHIIELPVTAGAGEQWLSDSQRQDLAGEMTSAARGACGFAGEVSILEGSTVGTLCRLSAQAGLIVMGSRGLGGFAGLLVGSTSSSVAVHASCPVVVVRGEDAIAPSRLPVIVGIDDSERSEAVTRYAFAEASLHECEVVAIRAWNPGPDPLGEIDTAERHAAREALAPARAQYPEVKFSLRLVAERPGKALIDASAQAQLAVVGARGRGGFKGLLLGSVGLHLLHHAHCPVAIVR